MTNAQVLLDPTAENAPEARPRIARPPSIAGLRIGLLDIAKMRGDEYLDRLNELLTERGFTVNRYRKNAFTERASTETIARIRSECDVAIEALAD